MHQPDLPAPPPRRPDTASLLLEAVTRRQTQECLALVQQWVHRRGITDLRRFCAHELRSQQGDTAAAWLLDLLDRDATDREPDALTESQEPHRLGKSPAWTSAPEAIGATTADLAELAAGLHNRAEEAVDAAFAALAETFAEVERTAQPHVTPATAAAIAQASVPETMVPPPAPIPPSADVWPSASHSALAVASALQAQALAAETLAHAAPEASSSAEEIAQPASSHPLQQEISHAIPSMPGPGALIGRWRERLSQRRLPQLSQLRAVMRDCVDETMALLRGTDTEAEELEDGFQDGTQEPTAVPAWNPPATDFSARTLPSVPAAPPATAWSSATSQVDPPPRQPGTTPAAEPPVTRAAGLRRDLLQRRGGAAADRPAPAPSSLSDLCGWLPERDDLPRAS